MAEQQQSENEAATSDCWSDEDLWKMTQNARRRDVAYTFTSNKTPISARPRKKRKADAKVHSPPHVSTAENESTTEVEKVKEDHFLDCAHVTSTIQLDQEHRYAHLLIGNGAIVCTRWLLAVARLKTTHTLDFNSYIGIIRLSNMLHCSCHPTALEEAMTAVCNGVQLKPPQVCLHLKVAKLFEAAESVEEWVEPEDRNLPDHQYIQTFNHQILELQAGVWLAYTNRQFGTVRGNTCDCPTHRSPCPFLRLVSQEFTDEWDTATLWRQASVSWKAIDFMPDSVSSLITSEIIEEVLAPDSCPCGSTSLSLNEKEDVVPLYSTQGVQLCKVKAGHCQVCKGKVYLDGASLKLLNMGNYLVAHELLYNYLKSFVCIGMPLFSYHKMTAWNWLIQGDSGISYERLRLAWISFQKLITYGSSQTDNFLCTICERSPKVLICDGITLSFEKRYVTHINESEHEPVGPSLQGYRYEDRIMIRSAAIRKKLRGKDVLIDEGLIAEIVANEPWLHSILCKVKGCNTSELPAHWKLLLRDLTASTPAIGMVNPSKDVFSIGSTLLKTNIKDVTVLSEVHETIPVIYNVLRVDMSLLECLRPMITHLLCKVSVVTKATPHSLAKAVDEEAQVVETFPKLPQLYQRGTYAMDAKKSGICTKRTAKHKSLTPGVFCMSCAHGVCYGFSVMDHCESPNIPYTLIRTRFPKGPSMIVYDNSCNLHDYCLNRDPGYFKDTKFCVDRFHWHNHNDCSSGYNISNLVQCDKVNTQVAEQINAKLGKLRSLVSYCNEDNFKKNVLLYLWFWNTINLLKTRPPLNHIEEQVKKVQHLFTKK